MECGFINMLDKNQINSVKKNNGTTNSFQNYIVIHNTDKQTVYNFEVPGHHNYFAEGYLVHNKQKTGGYRRRGGIR